MIAVLARRHLRLFFRDRLGVFFSLLSPLIMLLLYAFFLANVQVEDLTEAFPGAPLEDIQQFITSWVFAGVIMVTTLTAGLAALSVFVEDHASGRFKDFIVSPITKRQLILGYLTSTFLIALIMTTAVLIVSQVYIAATDGQLLSMQNLVIVYGFILLLCAGFAALSSLVVTFIKTGTAFTSLNVIIGTAVGFLAGIYIQPGTLSQGVVNVMNSLPFSQGAALVREPFTEATAHTLTQGNAEAMAELGAHYGIGSLFIGGYSLSLTMATLIFIAIIIVFTALGAWRIGKKIG